MRWRAQTLSCANRSVETQWAARTQPTLRWSWSCCQQVSPSPRPPTPVAFLSKHRMTPFPPRATWFDDGSDDRGSHVLPDLHLQQRQHYFHYGRVEDVPISFNRVGANGGGEVSQRMRHLHKESIRMQSFFFYYLSSGCLCWCWWWLRCCGSLLSRPVKVASSSSTSSPSAPTCSPLSLSSSSWAAFGRGLMSRSDTRPNYPET